MDDIMKMFLAQAAGEEAGASQKNTSQLLMASALHSQAHHSKH